MINNLSFICKVPSSSTSAVFDWGTQGQESWRNTFRIPPIAGMCVLGLELGKVLLSLKEIARQWTHEKRGFCHVGLLAISSLCANTKAKHMTLLHPFLFLLSTYYQVHVNPLWHFPLFGLSLILVFNPFSLAQNHSMCSLDLENLL